MRKSSELEGEILITRAISFVGRERKKIAFRVNDSMLRNRIRDSLGDEEAAVRKRFYQRALVFMPSAAGEMGISSPFDFFQPSLRKYREYAAEILMNRDGAKTTKVSTFKSMRESLYWIFCSLYTR